MTRSRLRLVIGLTLVLACAALAFAQRPIWVGGGGGGRMRFASSEDFDGRFLYCRAFYPGGWSTDYPGADFNFSVRLAELTRVSVRFDQNREPHHVIVRLDGPELSRCPVLFMENVEQIHFTEQDVVGLQTYLLKGGFLWVDDFWGSYAWDNWAREIARVLPPGEFPMFDLPITHPVMHQQYDVKDFLQVSAISFWYRSGGSVSERGRDSDEVHYRGIQDSRGRLIVLATHNTDVSDTWEREGESQEYFNLFSPRGYAIGVNVVLYALTH